ncbi:MAG: choice-of-anchor tandem repeat GloVer-containing protein [Luteolibacter sp.]
MNPTTFCSVSSIRRLGFSLIACHFMAPVVLAVPVFEPLQAYPGAAMRRESKLFQATDGSLYGVTINGGTTNYGTIFKLTPDRTLTVLENLSLNTIWNPRAPFIQGSDNFLYGTSGNGGAYNAGTIFKMTSAGIRTTVHDFDVTNGSFPVGSLVRLEDGSVYGVTSNGGDNQKGTVFRMQASGSFSTLQSLSTATGYRPSAGLTKGAGSILYGTAYSGGANNYGTIFKIDSQNALSVLVNFNGINGSYPASELVKGTDGNYYGTTDGGGTYGDGTAFVMTPAGQLTALYSFRDGLGPKISQPGLALGPDGNFYSVTKGGGNSDGVGTLYRLTPGGVLSVIVNFNWANGSYPDAPLAVGIDGNLYGATSSGGTTSTGQGTKGGQIFRLRFGPSAVTKETSVTLTTSSYIKGSVNPGLLPTDFWFEYGTSPTLAYSLSFSKGRISGNNHDNTVLAQLSGLKPGTTYYYRIVASNADQPIPQKGLIRSFTTLPESTPASDLWRIQYFGQSASTGDSAEDADPDHDNLPNLLERAFNLSPLQSDSAIVAPDNGTSGQPNIRAVGDAENPRLRIEYIRRTASSNSGLVYTPESCENPGAPDAWTSVTGVETVTPIDSDWERVVIEEETGSGQTKRFGRLKISTSP